MLYIVYILIIFMINIMIKKEKKLPKMTSNHISILSYFKSWWLARYSARHTWNQNCITTTATINKPIQLLFCFATKIFCHKNINMKVYRNFTDCYSKMYKCICKTLS